jgi:hypothetical protein
MGKKTLTLACMFILCIILARAGTADAADTAIMAVDPPLRIVDAPSLSFTINVTLSIAHKIDFFDIYDITWDSTVLELETGTGADIVEGPYMKAFGSTVFSFAGINNTIGKIREVVCGFQTTSEANGTGVLFSIKFKSKAAGISPITIGHDETYLLDSMTNASWYMMTTNGLQINDGSVNVVPEFPASVLLSLFLVATTIAIAAATLSSRKRRILHDIP